MIHQTLTWMKITSQSIHTWVQTKTHQKAISWVWLHCHTTPRKTSLLQVLMIPHGNCLHCLKVSLLWVVKAIKIGLVELHSIHMLTTWQQLQVMVAWKFGIMQIQNAKLHTLSMVSQSGKLTGIIQVISLSHVQWITQSSFGIFSTPNQVDSHSEVTLTQLIQSNGDHIQTFLSRAQVIKLSHCGILERTKTEEDVYRHSMVIITPWIQSNLTCKVTWLSQEIAMVSTKYGILEW